VRLSVEGKVVYSPHDYGPEEYPQKWFDDASFPNNLAQVWNSHWGTVHTTGQAPIWLGEFGVAKTEVGLKSTIWFTTLLDYIKSNRMHFSYWCLNGGNYPNYAFLLGDWKTV
jgi:endoglucanase